jgi:hypothetical protein
MRTVSLEELQALLGRTPAMVQMHPLSLAFLPDEVLAFETAEEIIAALDSPEPQPEVPMVALTVDERFAHRLPTIRCDHDPFTTELNRILLAKLDWVKRWVLCQSQLPEVISNRAESDCVVLIIVDGLGLLDWKRCAPDDFLAATEPCFVDGISITEHGMKRIVGAPTIALRLAERGYERSFGFSYWERTENELTDQLFFGITEGVRKVRHFDEVLKALERLPLEGSFVQIVRQGLDQLSHRHRDRPDIAATVKTIVNELAQLTECLKKRPMTAQVFLTTDHGILWRDEHKLRLYGAGEGSVPPRYYEGLLGGEVLWRVEFEGNDYAALAYPFIRRKLRSDEWGVHGGLSFEESFVPLVKLTVP